MTLQKIFINSKDTVGITCSNCARTKSVNVAKVGELYTPFRVKCSCGHTFHVVFEKRRHYRKNTTLPGHYARADSKDFGRGMRVENLSQTGIGFITVDKDDIIVGDHLRIEFALDDDQKTAVKGTIIVACVKNNYVGGKFHNLAEHAKKQIGFYLMR